MASKEPCPYKAAAEKNHVEVPCDDHKIVKISSPILMKRKRIPDESDA